jgi:hypothetical protein
MINIDVLKNKIIQRNTRRQGSSGNTFIFEIDENKLLLP